MANEVYVPRTLREITQHPSLHPPRVTLLHFPFGRCHMKLCILHTHAAYKLVTRDFSIFIKIRWPQ